MSSVDYSKWDHIELSDDEDDTHPNVDTPSLFRWRHQARVERMQEDKCSKERLETDSKMHQKKMREIKDQIKTVENQSSLEQLDALRSELVDLEKQEDHFKAKEEELRKKEKLTPWNIDTICKEVASKTIINKYDSSKAKPLTDDERLAKQKTFTKDNEKAMKKYGMMGRYDDSQAFLSDNEHLACEETANYLVIWCIDLEVQKKHELMAHVSHQTIMMQFILELARSLDTHPRNCIKVFFSRIKLAEKQYMDAFNDELSSFKDRVRGRAQARLDEAIKELEEEERQQRLGPGGLDPVEVYESLPTALKECFDKKDIALLQKLILEIPKEEAEIHMKRCIDSGLWLPDGGAGEEAEEGREGDEEGEGEAAGAAAREEK